MLEPELNIFNGLSQCSRNSSQVESTICLFLLCKWAFCPCVSYHIIKLNVFPNLRISVKNLYEIMIICVLEPTQNKAHRDQVICLRLHSQSRWSQHFTSGTSEPQACILNPCTPLWLHLAVCLFPIFLNFIYTTLSLEFRGEMNLASVLPGTY